MDKIAIFVFFCFFQFVPAFAEGRHPFDLSKVPMDEGWEDTGIMAETIEPCGKDHLYMGLEDVKDGQGKIVGYKLRVRNMESGMERFSTTVAYEHQEFGGCTSDSRFLLINASSGTVKEGQELKVYDTATMKVVGSFPHLDHFSPSPKFLSPDGRYLLTGLETGTIPLPGGNEIKMLPLLGEFQGKSFVVAWSNEGNTVYFLVSDAGIPHLIIHELDSGKRRTIELDFRNKDFVAMEMLVHPSSGRIFFRVGEVWGFHIVNGEHLFMLTPSQISEAGENAKVAPKRLGDVFASMTMGPDDTIIFSMILDSEIETSSFPEAFNGIFIADMEGKARRRITTGSYDFGPALMPGRQYLIFKRKVAIPDYGSAIRHVIYRKNSVFPAPPVRATR